MAALPKGVQIVEDTRTCLECGRATLNAQTKVKLSNGADRFTMNVEIVSWVVSCWNCGFGYSKAEQDAEATARKEIGNGP